MLIDTVDLDVILTMIVDLARLVAPMEPALVLKDTLRHHPAAKILMNAREEMFALLACDVKTILVAISVSVLPELSEMPFVDVLHQMNVRMIHSAQRI